MADTAPASAVPVADGLCEPSGRTPRVRSGSKSTMAAPNISVRAARVAGSRAIATPWCSSAMLIAVISGITGNVAGLSSLRSMYVQVSSTPDSWRSATAAPPHVVLADAVLSVEELVSFPAHGGVIDLRESPMPLNQLLSRQTPPPRNGRNSATSTPFRVMWYVLPASTASITAAELLRNSRWVMTFTSDQRGPA